MNTALGLYRIRSLPPASMVKGWRWFVCLYGGGGGGGGPDYEARGQNYKTEEVPPAGRNTPATGAGQLSVENNASDRQTGGGKLATQKRWPGTGGKKAAGIASVKPPPQWHWRIRCHFRGYGGGLTPFSHKRRSAHNRADMVNSVLKKRRTGGYRLSISTPENPSSGLIPRGLTHDTWMEGRDEFCTAYPVRLGWVTAPGQQDKKPESSHEAGRRPTTSNWCALQCGWAYDGTTAIFDEWPPAQELPPPIWAEVRKGRAITLPQYFRTWRGFSSPVGRCVMCSRTRTTQNLLARQPCQEDYSASVIAGTGAPARPGEPEHGMRGFLSRVYGLGGEQGPFQPRPRHPRPGPQGQPATCPDAPKEKEKKRVFGKLCPGILKR